VVGGLGASHLCAEKPEMFDQEMLRVLHETYPQVSWVSMAERLGCQRQTRCPCPEGTRENLM